MINGLDVSNKKLKGHGLNLPGAIKGKKCKVKG